MGNHGIIILYHLHQCRPNLAYGKIFCVKVGKDSIKNVTVKEADLVQTNRLKMILFSAKIIPYWYSGISLYALMLRWRLVLL